MEAWPLWQPPTYAAAFVFLCFGFCSVFVCYLFVQNLTTAIKAADASAAARNAANASNPAAVSATASVSAPSSASLSSPSVQLAAQAVMAQPTAVPLPAVGGGSAPAPAPAPASQPANQHSDP
jgi:hypothetical protein